MLQILQLYYIFKKHLHFIKFMYIMSVANNKKIFQQKRNILQKFTYNIVKGGIKNMQLTKKQKRILFKNISIFLIKMLFGIALVYIDIVLILLVF